MNIAWNHAATGSNSRAYLSMSSLSPDVQGQSSIQTSNPRERPCPK